MRVAYLTSQYSKVKSGPGRFTQYLKEINNKEIHFTFFSDDVTNAEAGVIKVKKINFLYKIPGYWIIKFFLFYLSFKKENAKKPFDFILCSSAYEGLFLKSYSRKIPFYIMINDEKYMMAFKNLSNELRRNPLTKILGRIIGNYIERSVLEKANCVIANSIYTKNLIAQHYKIPDDKLKLLYKAVDLDYFKIKPHRNTQKIRNILFVKNDWRIGGLDIILKALAKLPWQTEINLNVVGISKNEHRIIKELSDAENFKGRLIIEELIGKEDLLLRLYQADLYILMSRKEALGVSLLEALSTGTPIIASDTGGIPEVLDFGKAGFIVPSNDSAKLAEVLEEINQSPDLLKPKIEHGIVHCKNFSKEVLEKNLKKIFLNK